MPATVLIVGQGLAGTLLGWAFERTGIDFAIVDAGHARAASRVGAGIINPITGQRIVKSWRVDEMRGPALVVYRELERELGVALVREMHVWRMFSDERERRIFAEKSVTGELAPFLGKGDGEGFWIEGAARVDTAALIAAMRARWLRMGKLEERMIEGLGGRSLLAGESDAAGEQRSGRLQAGSYLSELRAKHDLVIFCSGATVPEAFAFASVALAKGEILNLRVGDGVATDVVRNRGHWLLPTSAGEAKVGATYELGFGDLEPSERARMELEKSAAELVPKGVAWEVTGQDVGVRVTLVDKHPIAGRAPTDAHLGIFNGLGSKGALLAPWIARQWVNHLTEAVPFDPAVDVRRFWKG